MRFGLVDLLVRLTAAPAQQQRYDTDDDQDRCYPEHPVNGIGPGAGGKSGHVSSVPYEPAEGRCNGRTALIFRFNLFRSGY